MSQLVRVVRAFFRQHAHLAETLIAVVLSVGICPMVSAQDHLTRQGTAVQAQRKGQQPITEGLIATLKRLEQELNRQQEILKAAQTDRERRLVQAHIEFLKKERQSMQELLDLFVRPASSLREAAQEQRDVLLEERIQRQLEQDKRFPRVR